MPRRSNYERREIEGLLPSRRARAVGERSAALVLLPFDAEADRRLDIAIRPVLSGAGFGRWSRPFESGSSLASVGKSIRAARVILADLTGWNADVMYVLGLCHASGRCPLLIAPKGERPPFDLARLRIVTYEAGGLGMFQFRERLARAVRVFLAATDAPRG